MRKVDPDAKKDADKGDKKPGKAPSESGSGGSGCAGTRKSNIMNRLFGGLLGAQSLSRILPA